MNNEIYLKEVSAFPAMFEAGTALADGIKKIRRPRNIFIAGMGGSAVAGDILSDYLKNSLPVPIFVLRNYSLPAFAGKKDLLLAVSYSGNTEETLSALKSAKEKGLDIVGVASGGKLKSLVNKFVELPKGVQPRSALPYIFTVLLNLIEKTGLIAPQKKALQKTVRLLYRLNQQWSPEKFSAIARALAGKIPVIFSTDSATAAIGYRLKCQFNENSKVTAHLCVFPELNHNEIVNLAKENRKKAALVILKTGSENQRILKRIKITRRILKNNFAPAVEIEPIGQTLLEKTFSLIFFGDLLTVYLAEELGEDAKDVAVIEKFKKELLR